MIIRYIKLETAHLRLTLHDPADIKKVADRLPRLRESDEVTAAYLEIQGHGLLFANGQRSYIGVRGVPRDVIRTDPGLARYLTIVAGAFDLERKNSAVIGKALAAECGIR